MTSPTADPFLRGAAPVEGIVIETQRLSLRLLTLDDARFILELLNEPAFLRFIGDKGVRDADGARAYLSKGPIDSYERHGFGLYAACLRDGTPVGICGLVKRDGLDDADLGFAFLSQHWSQGYAAESAAAVLAHAGEKLGLKRVVAITSPDNRGSMAVLEKVGLKFERTVRLAAGAAELNLFASGH